MPQVSIFAMMLSSFRSSVNTIHWKEILIRVFLILLTIWTFLFGIDLMVTSFNLLNAETMDIIVGAMANPFTALFIGLLVTAIIQSSSAATSIVVALVASGSVSHESAVPLIMGANVGTTITSTFVSIGFITMGKEYRRAVAASTSHDFFNILTVVILFPLEYNFHFLSGLSKWIADTIFDPATGNEMTSTYLFGSPLSKFLVGAISNEWVLIAFSFILLLVSILTFRSIIANWLDLKDSKSKIIFKRPLFTFLGGIVSTALIRSSTITTSLVVPLVAKRVIKLRPAFLFILGANIGTTITALIVALSHSHTALGIAFTHLLFNCIGVFIFILPGIGQLPVYLARGFSRLSARYRFVIIVYLVLLYFIIPFTLIIISK